MSELVKALIVVYNKSLFDSITFQSIKGIEDLDVIIADNSTKDFGNKEIALESGCEYINMHGNQGLSKAYNKAISMLEKNDNVICIFDDDTRIGSDYFTALVKAVNEYQDINIFAPLVMDNAGLLSPCIINGIKGSRAKSLQDIPQNGISVINSGLAVRLKVFKDYVYDEGQFLDYIDHAFIRDTINHDKSKIYIMNDIVIGQSFSGSEKSSRKADMIRYKIYKKDVTYFCKKYGIPAYKRDLFLLKRRLSLFIKHLL